MIKRPYLLQSRLFLLGLGVLVVNDHYFKLAYPNWFTGKVSDFAGLFILPVFLSAVSGRSVALNCFLSALVFTVWKSPLVEPLITAGNAMGLPFHRTIDFTDLIALVMLPLSYRYITTIPAIKPISKKLTINTLALISFIGLTSTSMAPDFGAEMKKSYRIKRTRPELLNEIEKLNCELEAEVSDAGDTVYVLRNLVVQGDSIIRTARFRIKEKKNGSTLTLLYVKTFRSYPGFFTWASRRRIKKIAKEYLIEEIK